MLAGMALPDTQRQTLEALQALTLQQKFKRKHHIFYPMATQLLHSQVAPIACMVLVEAAPSVYHIVLAYRSVW
jgi:hypothetical protein